MVHRLSEGWDGERERTEKAGGTEKWLHAVRLSKQRALTTTRNARSGASIRRRERYRARSA